eukprot:m51a1_g1241 hypothetical protein (504) ;mRNA; r:554868-557387
MEPSAEAEQSEAGEEYTVFVVYPPGTKAAKVTGVRVGWDGDELTKHIRRERKIPYDDHDIFLDLPDGLGSAIYASYTIDPDAVPHELDTTQKLRADLFKALSELKKPLRPVIVVRVSSAAPPLDRRPRAVMDQSYGAGKTTLACRFREVLAGLSPAAVREEVLEPTSASEDSYRSLMDAVTIYVKFNGNAAVGTVEQAASRAVGTALIVSGINTAGNDLSTADQVLSLLGSQALNCQFLFVFDEIQHFELYRATVSISDGVKALYEFWDFAEQLRSQGHYYVLCGRSKFLYLIGQGDDVFPERPQLDGWLSEAALYAIRSFTAGVPRILYYLVPLLKKFYPSAPKEDPNVALMSGDVLDVLQSRLTTDFSLRASCSSAEEETILDTLHDLAWSEMPVIRGATVLCRRNISMALAWAGFYNASLKEKEVVVCLPRFKKVHRYIAELHRAMDGGVTMSSFIDLRSDSPKAVFHNSLLGRIYSLLRFKNVMDPFTSSDLDEAYSNT